jgi:serine phosphatase RsbU (regulator of sigma subunit)
LRRIKKQNERLERIVEERTEEIREKTNQILDSIRYAETIQAAILPTEEEFKTYLPNGFKIYLPRDIVSGDFYWLKHTKGMTYVAVVDCTGHGVPGAFMSMIGASLLNDTVNQAAGAQTAFVLSTLHEKIRIALRQEDERNTDGMDIALCAIDEKNSKLLYTGAKRSLYIVRNKEVLELKGDRKSVGGRSKKDKDEKEFTTKEFPLLRGDMVYLTTDGFVDQPDESGKKYGSLNLFKDLVDISTMGINEQRKFLSEKLRKHSGNAKQRDDITLIGFRF